MHQAATTSATRSRIEAASKAREQTEQRLKQPTPNNPKPLPTPTPIKDLPYKNGGDLFAPAPKGSSKALRGLVPGLCRHFLDLELS